MRLVVPAVVLAAVLAAPQSARAAVLTFVSGFGTDAATVTSLTPFDPSLGSLDRVDVTIDGTLVVQVSAPASGIPLPMAFVPIPYTVLLTVDQRFAGVGGFFEFGSHAVLTDNAVAPGAGPITMGFAMNYGYAFSFTSATDLIGFTLPTSSGVIPPVWIGGTRADFEDGPGFPGLMVVTHSPSVTAIGGLLQGPLFVSDVGGNALITLTYTYTPSREGPVDPGVPEPALVLLLATGASVALARRGAASRGGVRNRCSDRNASILGRTPRRGPRA